MEFNRKKEWKMIMEGDLIRNNNNPLDLFVNSISSNPAITSSSIINEHTTKDNTHPLLISNDVLVKQGEKIIELKDNMCSFSELFTLFLFLNSLCASIPWFAYSFDTWLLYSLILRCTIHICFFMIYYANIKHFEELDDCEESIVELALSIKERKQQNNKKNNDSSFLLTVFDNIVGNTNEEEDYRYNNKISTAHLYELRMTQYTLMWANVRMKWTHERTFLCIILIVMIGCDIWDMYLWSPFTNPNDVLVSILFRNSVLAFFLTIKWLFHDQDLGRIESQLRAVIALFSNTHAQTATLPTNNGCQIVV